MSANILPEVPGSNLGVKLNTQARLAVLIAYMLARFPPIFLEKVMRLLLFKGHRPPLPVIVKYRAAVVSVSDTCAGHGCLPRSIATVIVARMNGYGIAWFTGVKDAPFTAHAWVEVAGSAVNELIPIGVFSKVLSAIPQYQDRLLGEGLEDTSND